MKKIILLILLCTTIKCYSQQAEDADKKAVLEKVNHFFVALEKQDPVLYKSIMFPKAQIWVVRKQDDSLTNTMRTFAEDIQRFNPQRIIQERPLTCEIKIHNDIAMAWVPYELSVNGKFSHCGVDVFTLLKTNTDWKIVNLSYSVEPDGCTAIKKKYYLE